MHIQSVRFLIVEDSSMMQSMLMHQLKHLGAIDISIAVDGVDALQKLRAAKTEGRPFQIVLLDWVMPGINGLDLLRVAKLDKDLSGTVFFMISTVKERELVETAVNIRPHGYLLKPFLPEVFASRLLSLCQDASTAVVAAARGSTG